MVVVERIRVFRDMGCFPCFESKEGAQLGRGNESDRKREEQPMVAPRVEKLSLGEFELLRGFDL